MPLISTSQQSTVYSVSELNQMVAMTLSESFLALNVIGEVSNFSCPRSGHWYFSLKDEKAQVRCVFFQAKQRAPHLQLEDGMQVVAQARLRLYETRGEFQLNVESLELVGDGLLQKKFEALKKQLAQEGLFDSTNKKPLPKFVKTVGLITSSTGAVIRDILSVLKRRFPGIQVILYPTLVQGEEAAKNIVRQIKTANQRKESEVLLLARGGGSLEDLWPFNEEIVARAIASSHLPIVSAVGHETDITIADFVADVRAPTPSAAAELISCDQVVLANRLVECENQLIRTINNILKSYQERLNSLKRCLRHPEQRLQNIWQQLDEYDRRLQQSIAWHLETKKQKLASLARALETLNPLATLTRGYSLTKKDQEGTVVQDASQVQCGDNVMVQLSKGKLVCEVKERILTQE